MQLMFAAVHTAMHLTAAVVLMVLLELGVETCIKCALRPRLRLSAPSQ